MRAGLGWLLAGGVFLLLWLIYPRGLGYGDVRLSGVLGIALGYLGWGELLVGVYGGFLLGGVGGGLLAVSRLVDRKAFPFGPFMLVGALVGVAWGADLWAYLVADVSLKAHQRGRERLTACCVGSPRASPTALPWSRSWRACRPMSG